MHKNKAADSPVFLVVDVQVDVVAAAYRRDDVVANIAALVDRARAKGIPVVWVRHQNARLRAESPGWQIVPELAPLDGEPIVDKRFGDAFADTDLGEVLERLNADRIVRSPDRELRALDLQRGPLPGLPSDAHHRRPHDGRPAPLGPGLLAGQRHRGPQLPGGVDNASRPRLAGGVHRGSVHRVAGHRPEPRRSPGPPMDTAALRPSRTPPP